MNKKFRDLLKSTSTAFGEGLNNLVKSIVSLLRVLVLSRMSVALKSKRYKDLKLRNDCTILATGPSLKKAFEDGAVHWKESDVFVVNMFVLSPEFWEIKPRFYFLADGAFFEPKDDRNKEELKALSGKFERIDWEMNLFIPSSCVNGGILANLTNPYIKVLRCNSTTFEGFKGLCHPMYRHCWAMPRCQTVTNMALTEAINMGYKNVYLYGADHSWTRDLCVNDDNEVCYGDRHVYATGLQVIKKEGTISELLIAFARMFESHILINDYARSRGVKIWNCTRGSFIDAYERIKL